MKGHVMNKSQKVGIAIAAVAVLLPFVLNEIVYRVGTSKKIAEINAEGQLELTAIKLASDIMTKRIQNGEYEHKSVDDMESDFHFFVMMNRIGE